MPIVEALRETSPYSSGSMERAEDPWRLQLVTHDATPIAVTVGNGNAANPEVVWIEFGLKEYQNPQLRSALRSVSVSLWEIQQKKREGPAIR